MIAWTMRYWRYVLGLLSVVFGLYVYLITPGLDESHHVLNVMKSDFDEISKSGGIIVSRKEVDKYGVADLTVEFVAGSLSDGVRKSFANALTVLGWRPIDAAATRYCKDGAIYSTHLADITYNGWKVLIMQFRFTAQTIATCKSSQKAGLGHQ